MNLENLEVRIKEPYPEIVNAEPNRETVCILKNLFTSRKSELTAVLQYAFQSVIADITNPEIAEILEEISIVEMMHLHLLMHATTKFGGVPRYEDCQGNYFNSNAVYTSTKLKEMLEANIIAEKQAIEEYKKAASRVENESLKNLFNRIIKDEEQHIKVFNYIKDNVNFLSI